jgi:hypothetical protein
MPRKPPKPAPKKNPGRPAKQTPEEAYEKKREAEAHRSRVMSERRREIGPLREPKNPARRERCRDSVLEFNRAYFPKRFRLQFAECHFTAIQEMQSAVENGDNVSVAMPRGTGKTALAETELLHAILYGKVPFAILLQANEKLAEGSFKKIKKELETNDLLDEDFPEVTQPLRALRGQYGRSAGQTVNGQLTRIEWRADGVTLPTVAGSPSSGAIIRILGIESAARGLSAMLPDGTVVRPGLVLADDCQTRQSAKSPLQTTDRETILTDDIMGMAGPGEDMTVIMLCTVIYVNDLSERFLSSEKHPEFRQIRTKMIEQWPTNMARWEEYAEARRDSQRMGDNGRRSNQFYLEHQAEMDAGARVSWPERKRRNEISGIQSAMNLWIKNPKGFRAEYQNEPEEVNKSAFTKQLIAARVATRLSGLQRCEVPREATRITCFIDVGNHLHWYTIVAWNPTFGGSIIDYGTWPQQNRAYFARSDPRPGLRDIYPGIAVSAQVYAGLNDLCNLILPRYYIREGSKEELRIERCMIDSGDETTTVYQFCRQSPYSGIIYPSKGIGRTSTARGVSEWKPKPGERSGYHWILGLTETNVGRVCKFDPDMWKSFLHERLTCAPGSRGYLSLYGRSATDHEMISEHCAAEQGEPETKRGITFDKWLKLPHNPDNDLFDCIVGNCVAASVQGLVWDSAAASGHPGIAPQKRVSLNELRQQAIDREQGKR